MVTDCRPSTNSKSFWSTPYVSWLRNDMSPLRSLDVEKVRPWNIYVRPNFIQLGRSVDASCGTIGNVNIWSSLYRAKICWMCSWLQSTDTIAKLQLNLLFLCWFIAFFAIGIYSAFVLYIGSFVHAQRRLSTTAEGNLFWNEMFKNYDWRTDTLLIRCSRVFCTRCWNIDIAKDYAPERNNQTKHCDYFSLFIPHLLNCASLMFHSVVL